MLLFNLVFVRLVDLSICIVVYASMYLLYSTPPSKVVALVFQWLMALFSAFVSPRSCIRVLCVLYNSGHILLPPLVFVEKARFTRKSSKLFF